MMLPRLIAFVLAVTLPQLAFAQTEVLLELFPKEDFSSMIAADYERIENCDLVVTVSNKGQEAIEIPQDYSPKTLRICAKPASHKRWSMVLIQHSRTLPKPKPKPPIPLPAGEKHQIVLNNAADIVLSPGNTYALEPTKEFTKLRWVWTWQAHPGPDYSPFEHRKGDRTKTHAVLWAELDFNSQTLRSIPLPLKRVVCFIGCNFDYRINVFGGWLGRYRVP